MRKCVMTAVGLALLAVFSWASAPTVAMPISAPAALKGATDDISLTENVYYCWGGGCYGYYRPYWGYRPYYYRRYYRPYWGYYRPYYRPYWGYRPYYYRPYWGYYRPYWY
jgi:hypothetical protein